MPAVITGLVFLGLSLLLVLFLSLLSTRVDQVLSRLALGVFRDAVEAQGRYRERREQHLQSVHATVTYPVYASKTLLYSAITGVAGSLIAVYGFWLGFSIITAFDESIRDSLPETLHFLVPTSGLTTLSLTQIFVLLLVSSATFGSLAGGLMYYGRWWYVKSVANRREIMIDESVARTIAFIYALSRSGMAYPEILRTVGDNRRSFGESAEEIGVVVKDIDLFGADLITALQRISQRTPSEQFSDFAENFANVLQTGRNVSDYLRELYDQYQEERVANQERMLELFTALGEAYVAGLVAGPLFLLTILLIFGILTGGLLDFLNGLVYLLIPLANLGFVWYLDSMSESLTTYQVPITHELPDRSLNVRRASASGDAELADGGVDESRRMNQIRFSAYQRVRAIRATLRSPLDTLITNPSMIFTVTVPVVLLITLVRIWPIIIAGSVDVRALDDIFIQGGLFLIGSFAIVRELHSRRLKAIEGAVPDLLDRLASTNEAGMTFTDALEQIDRSDLGALDAEVSKLLADVEWGARTERALYRFSARIKSSTISRIVALITNAMNASGNIGPVIRIASDEAREDQRLKEKRRQELFMYVIIIYLSFFVFLGIGVALQKILIPAIPSAEALGGIGDTGAGPVSVDIPINPVTGAEKDKYTLVLYHAAMVQGIVSGLVAGKMGEGSIKDGAKHVAVMLGIAYGLFLLFGG